MACELLHRSSYSSVFLGSPSPGQLSCYKVYDKSYPLAARHWLNISRECCVLSRLHEARINGVVQLISVADTPHHFSLQFKPCLGGNLYQAIERRECCDEAHLCQKVIIPLLRVLADLHALGIIHRDIKPENIFFEADGQLVLGDFGLAIDSNLDKPCSRVGTLDYMAPEVLAQPSADTMAQRNIPRSVLRPYNSAVDTWALGILMHEALTGMTPFAHNEPAVAALKAQFGAAARLPGHVSAECQAFVDAVLQKQPSKRPTVAMLLQHPWVLKHVAGAPPAPKSVRYACPSQQQLQQLSSGDLAVLVNTTCSSGCSGAPASCKATARCMEGLSAAVPAPEQLVAVPVGSAPAAASVLRSTNKLPVPPSTSSRSTGGSPLAAAAGANGCPVTYGFHCPAQQQQQQQQQACQQQVAAITANVSAATVAAGSAFDRERVTISCPSANTNSSEEAAKLVLVPALSAPMLLEPPVTAPTGRTSESGCDPALDHSSEGESSSNWRISAVSAAAGDCVSHTEEAGAAAQGKMLARGSSWSPGHAARFKAELPVNGTSTGTAAGHCNAAAALVADAMEASRVPAAGACAAVAAAAAGARAQVASQQAAAAAAAGMSPAMKQLLSPTRSAALMQRLRGPLRSRSVGGREARRFSSELLLSPSPPSATQHFTSSNAMPAVAAAQVAEGGDTAAFNISSSKGLLKVHRKQQAGALRGTQHAPAAAAAGRLLARSASEAHAVLPAVAAPQSPGKACRTVKGVCKKVLQQVFRQSQQGHVF